MATGRLSVPGQHDWLAVSLIADQAYVVTLDGLTDFAALQIGTAEALDKGVSASGTTDYSSFATSGSQTAFFTPDISGTYYVDVSDAATAAGNYDVEIAPVSTDYSNTVTRPGAVSVGGTTSGTLAVAGQHDWLGVSLVAHQAYLVTLSGLSAYSFLQIGTPAALDEGQAAYGLAELPPAGSQTDVAFFSPDTTGTYYIDVADLGTPGNYTVGVASISPDYSNNPTHPGTVSVGGTTTGTLTAEDQHDWIAVSLVANQAYLVTVTGLSNYGTLLIGTAAALDEGVSTYGIPTGVAVGSVPETKTAFFTPDTSGTYYIDLANLQGGMASYTVGVAAVATDYTNNPTRAGAVTVGGTTTGTLGTAGQHDWIAVSLTANQAYLVTLSGLSGAAGLGIGTAAALDEGIVATETPATAATTPLTQTAFFTPDTSGTYYIDVSDGSGTGSYTVSLNTVSTDYSDNPSRPGAVSVGGSTTGTLGTAGQHDWIAVTLSANQAYLVTLHGLSSAAGLGIGTAAALDEGVAAAGTPVSADATPLTHTTFFTPDTSGTYYIDVSDFGGIGSYTVDVAAVATDYSDTTSRPGLLTVACFAAGSRITTEHGEVPVEDLREGTLLRTLGASPFAPVKWIGHRHIDCTRHPDPRKVWPVRVLAHAVAENMPYRDLWLSPDHAVFLAGALIPVRQLINGRTIVQVPTDRIVYYHVELPRHGIVFAEGMATESYLDTGNRASFANGGRTTVLHPDFDARAIWKRNGAAPYVTGEERVRPVWENLAARADALGMPARRVSATSDPAVRLKLGDRLLIPVAMAPNRYIFAIPPHSGTVRLLSRAAVPTDLRPWCEDDRRLGVSVYRIVTQDGCCRYELPMDHPGLSIGWWDVERYAGRLRRWTNGDAILPLPDGTRSVEIHLTACEAYACPEQAATLEMAEQAAWG